MVIPYHVTLLMVFCKPTIKALFILVWFSDDFCLIFTLRDFYGRMTKIEDIYWIEIDSFVHSSISNESDTTQSMKGTRFPYVHAPHAQNPHNPSLSRSENFPQAQTFCSKPEPQYTTQYSDIFVTYTSGSNMHTGLPTPHSVINEHLSEEVVLDPHKKQNVFPAPNVSNNFATIDYDAHIKTKIDYTINHVFRFLTAQELNTLHTICELEQNQLLIILAMSVQNPKLAGFFFNRKLNYTFIRRSFYCIAL